MANLLSFLKNPRNVANLVDFLFYKRKSFEEPGPHPIFFTMLRKIDWNVQLCERNHGLVFWGHVEDFSRFRSLRRFWTFLCCVVLRACRMKGISSLSFSFLFFPLRASQQIAAVRTHALSLPRSRLPCKQQLERLPLCPPSPLYLRTEHINKRRKEPLETESQGAVLWLCKVVYYYLLERKKKAFCELALA